MDDTVSFNAGLTSLLMQCENGASPEDICANFPDRLEELKRTIRELEAFKARWANTRNSPDSAPKSFGPYIVQGLVGKGGFGCVYRAYDSRLEDCSRIVAVKELHPHQSSPVPAPIARLREARVATTLDHQNIVPVWDIILVDGRIAIIYKFIDGQSLAERIAKKGTPTASQSASLVAQIADALAYAHKHNIFHRDVKPGNILLDGQGVPYLTDFGIAVREEQLAHEGTAGTEAYMSPEQIEHPSTIDGRSDVYSLGIVLYELLSGTRPFRPDLGNVKEQITDRGREAKPFRQNHRSIPSEMERVCLKAIKKNSSERFQTAGDFAEALRKATDVICAFTDATEEGNIARMTAIAKDDATPEQAFALAKVLLEKRSPADSVFDLLLHKLTEHPERNVQLEKVASQAIRSALNAEQLSQILIKTTKLMSNNNYRRKVLTSMIKAGLVSSATFVNVARTVKNNAELIHVVQVAIEDEHATSDTKLMAACQIVPLIDNERYLYNLAKSLNIEVGPFETVKAQDLADTILLTLRARYQGNNASETPVGSP